MIFYSIVHETSRADVSIAQRSDTRTEHGACSKDVKYGQFEPELEGDETTEKEKEKRRKRQNTFAPELPTGWIRQNGGMVALRQREPKKNHKYPQQQHQHQHHHITTFSTINITHTQYHTSNSKCKSIDSHNRMGRCRLLSRNSRE